MAYNSADALREAGNRFAAIFPDVRAKSREWTAPEANEQGFDAAMLCACCAWSGSGTTQPTLPGK